MNDVLAGVVQSVSSIALIRSLLRIVVRVIAPRNYVGAVGAVVNREGKVLLARHAYRTDFPWGLPGGWVERGEDPAVTVEREIAEELKLNVEVQQLLICGVVPRVKRSIHPPHLGLAFLCRPLGQEIKMSSEITAVDWIDPAHIPYDLAPLQAEAIAAARKATR
jgi:ADP-ribose pyrophosphatase YjhB (NUDIX family)